MNLPADLIKDHKKRVRRASTLVKRLNENPKDKELDELQTIAHSLAGTSDYFDEIALATASRRLEIKLGRMSPEQKKEIEPKTFLESFDAALQNSSYFRG